jgi:2-polyprenyl-3-methyl-5-hydroxy-6-metoxy-1,4-benzoquinol methylase
MPAAVQQQLLTLNRQFYATVANEFANTRHGLPAGMLALATALTDRRLAGRVLDVGCGNGRFARALAQVGAEGTYWGIDADPQLLAWAQSETADLPHIHTTFRQVDLAQPGWPAGVVEPEPFQTVVSLAVLHHFPGYALRRRLVEEMAGLLAPEGVLALSTWQFLTSDRLSEKLVDWATIGIDAAVMEPGDALLPWNQGAYALRYVHQLDLGEIEQLAADTGLRVTTTFRADGKEGNLNLFTILERA